MSEAVYFRQKAEQCRRLAAAIHIPNDPAKVALGALAKEFDAKAAAMEAEAVAAAVIGFGDGIGDQAPPVEKAEDGDGAKASAEPKGPAAGASVGGE